jgi:predicted SAM-dependent methyltransferase
MRRHKMTLANANMNWKVKCLAFYLMHYAPAGGNIHAWVQRRITRRYLPRLTQEFISGYLFNVRNFEELHSDSASSAFEFGAGANLLTSLLLSAAGASKVFVYDIKRLATVEQVNDAIRQLREMKYPNQSNPQWPSITNLDADLSSKYAVNYIAPGDARHTGLPANSIDFVYSTSTLEHIPKNEMHSILIECRRILKPGGHISFVVDYHDHYASADAAISRFNFFRYSNTLWKWFNPPNHYQNRLRHSDYERMFTESEFRLVSSRHIIPPGSIEQLQGVPVADCFRRYSKEDLAGLNGLFLLER